MKIIVQGNLVDTESIVKIGPVLDGPELMNTMYGTFGFWIYVLNGKDILVVEYDFNSRAPKEIIDLHAAIVKIWTDNKSDIPQFNLSSYGSPRKRIDYGHSDGEE